MRIPKTAAATSNLAHTSRAWLFGAAVLLAPLGQAWSQVVIPLATWGGDKNVINTGFVPPLEKALSELAPGKFKLQELPNGQGGVDKDMPVGIPTGKVKMGMMIVNGWSGTVRDVRVLDTLNGLSMQQLDDLVHQKGLLQTLQPQFVEKQTVLLGLGDLGPPAVLSKKKLLVPADFKGLKVRVFSEGQSDMIKAFGGVPVRLGAGEVYTAMQHGTVDAAIFGYQAMDHYKLYEVGNFILRPASFFGTTMVGWAANLQWFRSMPAAEQKVLEQAVLRAAAECRTAILKEIDGYKAIFESKKMTVTELQSGSADFSTWLTATAPIIQAARSEVSPKTAQLVFGR